MILTCITLHALLALDDELGVQKVTVSITPPANPVVGQLWFDSEDIEMSVWYSAPGDSLGTMGASIFTS